MTPKLYLLLLVACFMGLIGSSTAVPGYYHGKTDPNGYAPEYPCAAFDFDLPLCGSRCVYQNGMHPIGPGCYRHEIQCLCSHRNEIFGRMQVCIALHCGFEVQKKMQDLARQKCSQWHSCGGTNNPNLIQTFGERWCDKHRCYDDHGEHKMKPGEFEGLYGPDHLKNQPH
ncbi:hypothetical protein DL546_004934 [Coniochaeta pulveracea]|uniref:CFEM domain-containing protein n=1 Tax=Coniochaeta pulveracea TaxID=177199 RepID=A0A420YE80_9PEZI|nr:hypothetical protein DL546_004934 [Coniochaeta pulveracea]